jgi:uncharacterized membrane protein YdjX (TVP38/TMEM64 family)
VLGGVVLVGALLLGAPHLAGLLGQVEAWLAGLGVWAGVLYVAVFVVLTSVFVPGVALTFMAGGLFGLAEGTALVAIGALLGAALQYVLARRLLHARVESAVEGSVRLTAVQRALTERELGLQVLLRLTPLNPPTLSYLLGAMGVRFRGFVVASLALIPMLFFEVYLGATGRRLAGLSGPTTTGQDVALWGGLASAALVIGLVTRFSLRAVREATAGDETGRDPTAPVPTVHASEPCAGSPPPTRR